MKYAAYISILSVLLTLALSSTFLGLKSAWADSVIKTISFDSSPEGVAYDSINGKIYVTGQNPTTLSEIDTSTNTVEDSVPLGGAEAIAFNSANNRLYVTSLQQASSLVVVVDPSNLNFLHLIPVGNTPVGIAVDPADNKIYVSNAGSDTVSVIDGATDQVVKTISVGHIPYGVAFNPVNGNVYVANQGSDTCYRQLQ